MKKHRTSIESSDPTSGAKGGIAVTDIAKKLFQYDLFEPHRGEHYFLFLNKGGSYSVKLDFQKYLIEKPAFLVIEPGHVHQILKIKNLKGYGICFDKASIYSDMEHDLKRISNIPIVVEFNDLTKILFALAEFLHELQQVPSNLFVKRASQGILRVFAESHCIATHIRSFFYFSEEKARRRYW